jgi:hypothetical protein
LFGYYCKEHAEKDGDKDADKDEERFFDCVAARPASGPKTWRVHYAQNDNERQN